MPPMTVLGWFHTVVGAAAILMATTPFTITKSSAPLRPLVEPTCS